MSDPYIGEIRVVSFNFPPNGWAFCNGQLLPISQNQALFSLLGTNYGGDGQSTFGLPNLQGRMPIHPGNGYSVGQLGGAAAHTLTINEMPAHNHLAQGQSATATTGTIPANAVWAASAENPFAPTPNVGMSPVAIGNAGGSQPHENRPPFLVLNFIIALQGVFPSRT